VDMVLDEVSVNDFRKRAGTGDFDAIVVSVTSGPAIIRPYLWWDSKGKNNRGEYSSPSVDAALDSIRHATSDDQYRTGVANFQKSILDDPPAIFLAWDEHARAVSSRFDVATQPGTDIIRTLHLWRPAAGAAHPGDN
jgi:ABC-type oligopeptide transport system substrate-binding subunit